MAVIWEVLTGHYCIPWIFPERCLIQSGNNKCSVQNMCSNYSINYLERSRGHDTSIEKISLVLYTTCIIHQLARLTNLDTPGCLNRSWQHMLYTTCSLVWRNEIKKIVQYVENRIHVYFRCFNHINPFTRRQSEKHLTPVLCWLRPPLVTTIKYRSGCVVIPESAKTNKKRKDL